MTYENIDARIYLDKNVFLLHFYQDKNVFLLHFYQDIGFSV